MSPLHFDVTHQNYCAAVVPKHISFKDSLTGSGCEILVPFFVEWLKSEPVVLRLAELAGR